MTNDTISDFLIRIKNAYMSRYKTVDISYAKILRVMGEILAREGYIEKIEEVADKSHKKLHVTLRYTSRRPAITNIERVSKPGLRVYVSKGDIPRVLGGLGTVILSTSKGVLTEKEARKQQVGGRFFAKFGREKNMSKIGKRIITIPENTTVTKQNDTITVVGPKGEIVQPIASGITVELVDKQIVVKRSSEAKYMKSLHGLTQALLQNAVSGVNDGFSKKLELVGVGYRAAVTGDELTLTVGFSHPVVFKAPTGITFAVANNVISISGIDKQAVGLIAQKIRAVRPPEPYKGKGIKYQGEKIRRKAGKAAKTATAGAK